MARSNGRVGNGARRPWAAYLSGGFGLGISAMLALLVPLRADELGLPIAAIGVIVAARPVAEAMLAVPLSLLVSRCGARATFVAGTACCTLTCVGFAVAAGYWMLLALSAAAGAGRALAWIASQSYVSYAGPAAERARNTGRFSFVGNLSQMVGPLVVGVAAAYVGYRYTFLLIAVHSLMFVALGLALPRRPPGEVVARVPLTATARLFRVPRLQVAFLLSFVRLAIPSAWHPFLPLLLVSAGYSAGEAGGVLSFAAVVATVVNLATGPLSRWASTEMLTTASLAAAAVGLLLSPHLLSVPLVLVPAALVGVGNGLSLPLLIALFTEAAPPGRAPLALGARNAVNSAATAGAPMVVAPLVASYGAATAFAAMSGVAGALLAVAVTLHHRRRRYERSRGGLPAPAGSGTC